MLQPPTSSHHLAPHTLQCTAKRWLATICGHASTKRNQTARNRDCPKANSSAFDGLPPPPAPPRDLQALDVLWIFWALSVLYETEGEDRV